MQEFNLIKTSSHELLKVGNFISLTNKMLELDNPQLIPFRKFNKWGFSDYAKNIIINCEFDSVRPFKSHITVVKLDNKYGIIDINGNVQEKIIYQEMHELSEGLIGAKINYKYGFLDTKGKIIIPFQYDSVKSFSNGLAKVYKRNTSNEIYSCLIDITGKMVSSWKIDDKYISKEYLNKDGTKTTRQLHFPSLDFVDAELMLDLMETIEDGIDKKYSEGLSIFERDNRYGFVDKSNTEIISNLYDFAMPFSHGIALIKLKDKYGYINKNGDQYWED